MDTFRSLVRTRIHGLRKAKDYILFRRVLGHSSRFRRRLDALLLALVLFSAWWIPFELVFLSPSIGIQSINWMACAAFLFDAYMNFNTSFYHSGDLVWSRKDIVRHYLRTWFPFDLVINLPFSLVGMAFSATSVLR